MALKSVRLTDMNVASLELCKELYELSGWGDTEKAHYLLDGKPQVMRWSKVGVEDERSWHELVLRAPAYDLGYLLRKVPEFLPMPSEEFFPASLTVRCGKHEWLAGYATTRKWIKKIWADTPEDAACKLAIELFKRGILQRDHWTSVPNLPQTHKDN